MSHLKYLSKESLHHAYLIEGEHDVTVPEIFKFIESLKIERVGNQDFVHIKVDSFKIDDARNLKSLSLEKAISGNSANSGQGKKIFIITANNFLLEAQNTLLKTFEEPIENTHFFIVLPDLNALLPTFLSRFYVVRRGDEVLSKDAEKFIKSSKAERINFLKVLLSESDEEEEGETLDSARARALKFLNSLEAALHKKDLASSKDSFKQIFNARKFLRQPGSSAKNLMESVALILPNLK